MGTATTSQAARAAADKRADTKTPLRAPEKPSEPVKPFFETESLPSDLGFSRGAARRPQPQVSDPILQWASGLPTTSKVLYAGWLIEADKWGDLDHALEAATQGGHGKVTIKHQNGNQVTHWALPTASLFVICDGVQTLSEMSSTPDRYGIAFAWRSRPQDGQRQSVLRCRVFVQELLQIGYTQPLTLSLKGTMTGDLVSCLVRHYECLDSINPIRAAAGKPPIEVPFYAVSLALGPGAEVQRGQGSQSRSLTPMAEVGARDQAYILSHWCKKAWVQQIEALVDQTIAWSVQVSQAIGSGEAQEAEPWEG